MNIYVLTDAKEFSIDGANFVTLDGPRITRGSSFVTIDPRDGTAPVNIFPAIDTVTIDNSTAANPYTPFALVRALKTAFPKGNSSGSAQSPGTSLLLGAMTKTQRDTIVSPVVGSQIYNSTDGWLEIYDSFWGWIPVYETPEWQYKYGFSYTRNFYNNFSDAFINQITNATGSVLTSQAPTGATSEYGGTIALRTNAAADRSGYISNTGVILLGSGITVFRARVRFPALSTGTDRFQCLLGFYDNPGAIDQTDGVYLLYDEGGVSAGSTGSPNWICATSSNGVRTFQLTSSVIAVNTWYDIRIEVNSAGTDVKYYINGTQINGSLVSTNIPTGLVRATGFGVLTNKSLGTNPTTVLLNSMTIRLKFANSK